MSGFARVLGRRLYYERIGTDNAGGAPLLIFLHEGLGSVAQWKNFPARLCERLGLAGLVYDRYGHGRSSALEGPREASYLDEEARDYLPALLAELDITSPLILVGHSDGGTIALLHAATNPAVIGIVTEAAHVFVEEITLSGIRAAQAAWAADAGLRQALERYHGDHTESTFRSWSDIWRHPGFRDWNIEPHLAAVTCPALVIQGELDEYGSGRQVDAIVTGIAGPATPLLMAGIGHAPHREDSEAVLAAVDEFIRTL
ncbi:MAG: alpha/beta hydrolase [Gammaproteobacteria bacterium]|nr:alpha/beta hydrolase [Gammaproteobacteria bacterium]